MGLPGVVGRTPTTRSSSNGRACVDSGVNPPDCFPLEPTDSARTMSEREREHDRPDEQLAMAVLRVAHELCEFRKHQESEFEWFKSHYKLATKEDLKEMEKRIMANQAELAADLRAVLTQQQKTSVEIATLQASVDVQTTKIAELEALLAAGGVITQELIDAVAAVKAQAQVIDDQIPDVLPPPV